MTEDNRIRYYAAADYTVGSDLDVLVKAIIDKTAAYEVLEEKHIANLVETRDAKKAKTAYTTLEKAKELQAQTFNPLFDVSASISEALETLRETYNTSLQRAITEAFFPVDDADDEDKNDDEESNTDNKKHISIESF